MHAEFLTVETIGLSGESFNLVETLFSVVVVKILMQRRQKYRHQLKLLQKVQCDRQVELVPGKEQQALHQLRRVQLLGRGQEPFIPPVDLLGMIHMAN